MHHTTTNLSPNSMIKHHTTTNLQTKSVIMQHTIKNLPPDCDNAA